MTPEIQASLQTLIQSNPLLRSQLKGAQSASDAAHAVAQAAKESGWTVDKNEIASLLVNAQTVDANAQVNLTDGQLEALAGGSCPVRAPVPRTQMTYENLFDHLFCPAVEAPLNFTEDRKLRLSQRHGMV